MNFFLECSYVDDEYINDKEIKKKMSKNFVICVIIFFYFKNNHKAIT